MFFPRRKNQKSGINEILRRRKLVEKATERNICARLSSGNWNLQNGNYITEEDLDKMEKELFDFLKSDAAKWG